LGSIDTSIILFAPPKTPEDQSKLEMAVPNADHHSSLDNPAMGSAISMNAVDLRGSGYAIGRAA